IYNETVDIPVTISGEEYTVKMYPFFSPEKVRECVDSRNEFLIKADKEKLQIPQHEIDDITGYFIISHFTNLKLNLNKKAKSVYSDFKEALNSPLFKVLMKSFPQESIKDVYDRIFDLLEAQGKLEDQLQQFQEQIAELPLENRDVIFGKQK